MMILYSYTYYILLHTYKDAVYRQGIIMCSCENTYIYVIHVELYQLIQQIGNKFIMSG